MTFLEAMAVKQLRERITHNTLLTMIMENEQRNSRADMRKYAKAKRQIEQDKETLKALEEAV